MVSCCEFTNCRPLHNNARFCGFCCSKLVANNSRLQTCMRIRNRGTGICSEQMFFVDNSTRSINASIGHQLIQIDEPEHNEPPPESAERQTTIMFELIDLSHTASEIFRRFAAPKICLFRCRGIRNRLIHRRRLREGSANNI